MSDDAKNLSPAYITSKAFGKFINDLSETTMPARVDRSMFGTMNGGLAYSIISALKFLNLIDAAGVPTPLLAELVRTQEANRGPVIKKMLIGAYPTFWQGSIDLETATAGQFNEHLREEYKIEGSTIDKAAAFFLAAAEQAGIPISPHIKKRTLVRPSPSSRKAPNKRASATGALPTAPPSPFTAPLNNAGAGNEVAVLMGIIDMEAMDEAETEAVWTLVKFLKRQEAARRQPSEPDQ